MNDLFCYWTFDQYLSCLLERINVHIHNHTWMILKNRYKISIVHARFIINDNWSNNPSILNENPILCSTSQSQHTLKRLKFPFQKHIFIQIFVCWCVHVVYCRFNLFSNSFNSRYYIYVCSESVEENCCIWFQLFSINWYVFLFISSIKDISIVGGW